MLRPHRCYVDKNCPVGGVQVSSLWTLPGIQRLQKLYYSYTVCGGDDNNWELYASDTAADRSFCGPSYCSDQLIAFASLLFWLRMFEALSIQAHAGPLVNMIIVMIRVDLINFLQIGAIMLLSYSVSLSILEEHGIGTRIIEVSPICIPTPPIACARARVRACACTCARVRLCGE